MASAWSKPFCEHIPAVVRGPPVIDPASSLITRSEIASGTGSQTPDSQRVAANSAQPRTNIPVSINIAKPLSEAERRSLLQQIRRNRRERKLRNRANKRRKINSDDMMNGTSNNKPSMFAGIDKTSKSWAPPATSNFGQAWSVFGQTSAMQPQFLYPFTEQPSSFGQASSAVVTTRPPYTRFVTFGQPSLGLPAQESLSMTSTACVPAIGVTGTIMQGTTVPQDNFAGPIIERPSNAGDRDKGLQQQLEQKAGEIEELQRKLVSLHETNAAERKEFERQLQCKSQSVQVFIKQSKDDQDKGRALELERDLLKGRVARLEKELDRNEEHIARLQDERDADHDEIRKLEQYCDEYQKGIHYLEDLRHEDKRINGALVHYIDHAQGELNNFLDSEDAIIGFLEVLRVKRRCASRRTSKQPSRSSQQVNRPIRHSSSSKPVENLITTFVGDTISQARAKEESTSGELNGHTAVPTSPTNPIDLTQDE